MNRDLKKLIFKVLALAMGIATFILTIMNKIESKSAVIFLSIGLTCLAINELEK